ncbi:MAG: TonB-dependent receptor [Mameliella sp.]|nr:TonB-dependent receptor [Phaeodactylibacter sp.]
MITRSVTTLLLCLCCFLNAALAQRPPGAGNWGKGGGTPKIKGFIKGTVEDPQSNLPVEFATIVLLSPDGSKQIDGTVTDADGTWRLSDVNVGKYLIRISFIGYEQLDLKDIETTPKKPDLDLGKLELSPNAVALEGVEVVGEASMIENRIDKLVYNAEKDVTNAGGNGADVLRKVPLLSVDLEGNVSLRGSRNIQILINGRPSTIFASSVADALNTIPGDQIKSVEVITTPSARYDGEGSGGIINIITKKREAEGFTGRVQTSIGNLQNNASANINALMGRFGVNGSLSSFWNWEREGDFDFLRRDFGEDQQVVRELMQGGANTSQVVGLNGSGGAFYDFNAYNSLNMSFRLNSFRRFNDGNIDGMLNAASSPLVNFSRFSDNQSLRSGFDVTTDYRKTWADKKDRELIFAFQVSGNESEAENITDQQGDIVQYQRDLLNLNNGLNLEYTIQADYVHPFNDKVKMETGLKSIIRRIDSDYRTEERLDDSGPYTVVPLLTDLFFYDQDVNAGYVSFNIAFSDKWGLVAGTRYEHTTIRGSYDSETPGFRQDYDNILPSIILNRKLGKRGNIKGSYTQRIQRPSLFFINPFTAITDPNNIQIGNPSLDPERVDQYELAYNTFVKGIVINGAIYYRRTEGLIERFLAVEEDGVASQTTFLNIGSSDTYGFNLFTSFTIKRILTIRGGFNYGIYNGQGQAEGRELERSAGVYSGNLSGTLKLGDKWRIEAFGFLNGPRQTLQGFNPSFSLFSMGANWEVSKRTTLGVRAVEPFIPNKAFASELSGDDFFQESNFTVPFRSIGINFSHKFGQMDFRQQNRRSRVRNTDQKGGESQNF